MTLRTFIAAIVTGLVVCTAWVPAIAGDTNAKTKASTNKASALKKGETVQTLAYRFDTYSTFLVAPPPGCGSTDPVCTQQLNTDLRSGSSTLFPSVRQPDGTPKNKVDANQKIVTPTND
ncbi:MAG: hypothetical protein EHM43_01410 [Ignavibacteriae bacterium]|nr:MAG: hypothetical protein EHM43_01410 [Ignavibacteriota bacterium]